MQPDANDIIYTNYGIDGIFKALYNAVLGSHFSLDAFVLFLYHLWTVYSVIAFALSILFIIGIVYAYVRITQLDEIAEEHLLEQEKMWKDLHGGNIENERWMNVQQHLATDNPNDWKLAIIEADVLLERMLEKAGFAGTTIADRLRSASARSFQTIDDAWQAHRVRNMIAHGGADFVLTQKIAKETLIMYERVFKEFDMI